MIVLRFVVRSHVNNFKETSTCTTSCSKLPEIPGKLIGFHVRTNNKLEGELKNSIKLRIFPLYTTVMLQAS
ncbi:14177_t:CDS:2 [Cetraspora pellucida]|uniref:14177_t:CDS:1 n=1 Tax=Cetraspora pellucida TaxID=1433469 RepID=A0A9N9FHU4_9GLOM|nr:14177_t:CDS:2 [Cetraspora pellucida]